MLVAQITDMHIKPPGRLAYRLVDTAAFLERAVRHLNALSPRPDVVLATGDLVDAGTAAEYGLLREILTPLAIPLLPIPGNHDERGALLAGFANHPHLRQMDGFICYTVEDWPVRLVALDSVIPGEPGGEVCARRRDWLDRALGAQPHRPTLVFVHHPPFATGVGHMDAMGLREPNKLAEIVRRHPQVERVLCGHLHRNIQSRWAGTIASTAPSTAHQVTLDLRPGAGSSFTMEPPGYHLHLATPGAGVVTHTAVIGDFPGPFPFFDGGKLID